MNDCRSRIASQKASVLLKFINPFLGFCQSVNFSGLSECIHLYSMMCQSVFHQQQTIHIQVYENVSVFNNISLISCHLSALSIKLFGINTDPVWMNTAEVILRLLRIIFVLWFLGPSCSHEHNCAYRTFQESLDKGSKIQTVAP